MGLEAGLQSRGIHLMYQTTITALRKDGDDVVASFANGVEAPYGAVMFATGRVPNVNGFGLAETGVKLNDSGAIAVDDFSKTVGSLNLCRRRRHRPRLPDPGCHPRRVMPLPTPCSATSPPVSITR